MVIVGCFRMPRVNQNELATLAGVSRATVSRALADHPGISQEIGDRIRSLARRMDYRPNAAARSFATRRHNTIAMVLCDRPVVSSVYGLLFAAVEHAARGVGLKLQFSLWDSTKLDKGESLPPTFQDDGVDGVVLAGAVPDELLKRMVAWRMPFVLIGMQQGVAGINHVGGDPWIGGKLMAEHLLGLGHRRLGLLTGVRHRPIHAQYIQGFRHACLEAGMDDARIERGIQECPSQDAIGPMRALLERVPDVTAVFADTDFVAWQTIQYLRAIGKRVPEDISVGGAGRALGMFNLDLELTTIDVRLGEMGRVAVQLLRELIAGGGASRRIVVDPFIVPGSTTAPPVT